jgi:hypothetical protein
VENWGIDEAGLAKRNFGILGATMTLADPKQFSMMLEDGEAFWKSSK